MTEYKATICYATLVYAHANTEAKHKAIEIVRADSNPTENIEANYIDKEIIKKLYGLK